MFPPASSDIVNCMLFSEKYIRPVMIEGVKPQIDCGRFPVKRTVGERIAVLADIFTHGNDVISGVLMYREKAATQWKEVPLKYLVNDRWYAFFQTREMGRYAYTLCAWVDPFKSWRRDLLKKINAKQDVSMDLMIGAELIEKTLRNASETDASWLRQRLKDLRSNQTRKQKILAALDRTLVHLMQKYPDKTNATYYDKELWVVVDRKKARYSTWYEMFPRSCGPDRQSHGSFKACEKRLPYIAGMGFDVLYLPPIHPIGRMHRKGKNNRLAAGPDDPGSPWAIGAATGGHRDIHPQLGTFEDFSHLIKKAHEHGMEIAMDIAFQCAPDHPYVQEHPEWFKLRPDGTIQYAENPPKKYEDIYPFDFESDQWQDLARELKDVVYFWIHQGVRIFRVDNPHTKPFAFWEWLIHSVQEDYPDVIFLSEAFTRPKVMYRLAKLGFSQSYTYFAWRNTSHEIKEYFEELMQTQIRQFFRPSLWPNTPDILPEILQMGGRPAFMARLVLAATIGSSYGIYGPAFELCEHRPRENGSEEYLNSEKYEIKEWDIGNHSSLKDFITRINRIRKQNPALQHNRNLRFHPVDNDQIVCYTKHTSDRSNIVLVAVNLDPHHVQSGWVELPLSKVGLDSSDPFQMHDLLSDARYLWHGQRNFIELDPQIVPAHIFCIRRKVRTERDFDYYL